ncbi:MAG: GNAT family N-acetyltransferase [Anaerolineaceae bacterium]|nr:GNAT family N-acetyltransferase [Anaerolineaceae bacterium]
MNPIRVRPITPDDIPTVAAWMVQTPLWQRYQLTVERATLNFEKAFERGEVLLVADAGADNLACGFAWCLPQGGFGRSMYLRLIGVRQERARAGVGAALLKGAEDAALKVGRELFLLVSDFNVDAQRFYQRQGYSQIGAIPGYVLPDVTELLYWKQLQ